METDSIGTGIGDQAVTIQFSIVPYFIKKGVKFSLPEAALQKAFEVLNDQRQELSRLLQFAGRLTEIELSLEESDGNSDEEDAEEEDLSLMSKINISVALQSTEGLKQLAEFLKPEEGLSKWISENIVPHVKNFKLFSVLLEEKYFKAVMKRVRSVEKQLKDAVPPQSPDSAEASTKPKSSAELSVASEPDKSVPIASELDKSAPAASELDKSAPAASEPDKSAPAASELDKSAPEASEPDKSAPAASEPDKSAPAASEPDKLAPAASEPDKSAPEASEPDKSAPAASEPDKSAPAASEPDKLAPAASEPDKSAPEASEPDKSAPAASELDKSAPEASEPDKSAPAASELDKSAPAASEPDKSAPAASEPDKSAPAASELDKSVPVASELDKSVPAASEPDKSVPAASEPDKSAPAASEPDKSAPAASELDKSVPVASELDKSVPAASEPDKSAPAASEPDKSAPAASELDKSAPAASELDKSAPAASEPDKSAPAASELDKSVPVASISETKKSSPLAKDLTETGATEPISTGPAKDQNPTIKSLSKASSGKTENSTESKPMSGKNTSAKEGAVTVSKTMESTDQVSENQTAVKQSSTQEIGASANFAEESASDDQNAKSNTKTDEAHDDSGNLGSWLTLEDYLKLDEKNKSYYIPFDFRLFIADIIKFIVEQVSSGRKGIADDQPFIKDLTNSLLEAKIDITVSLMLTNQKFSKAFAMKRKISSLKEFYTLPSWNLFVLKDKIGNFVYSYQLECRHQLLQVASIKQIQDHLRRFGPAVSSQIERALNSSSRISDTIVKCCSKKNSAPPDGNLCELQTRTLSKDRLVCFDALMEPYIDSVVGKSQFFWRIFASHAVSLALAESSTTFVSSDVIEYIDQSYCSLVTRWLKAVTENDSKKTLEANASEFNFVVKRMLSSPFAEKFSLKPGGGILLCRLSLFVQRRFAPENKSFWKTEEATLLLSFLQKPALKGVSSQALRFLDSSLPSFLCLCYCAKVLHPSNSANDFAKLVKHLGFVERGGDKFRTGFSAALLNSGLLRSISCSNFASTVSAVFNDAEDFNDAHILLEEFITIKEDAVEILSSFDSCEIVSPALKQFIHRFGASILYKKHLSDLQTESWQRFCDIMPKAKKLQCVDESVWHDEVLPVIRRAIIASVSNSKFENDSSVPNRQALCDLLNLRGLLDTKLAVDFLSIIFSSKTHWLIKFCLEIFAGTFLNYLSNAKDDCKMNIFCQFIRLSCDYFHKSVCATIAPLVQDSSCDSFKALCKESAHLVLNEKPLTRTIIETNVEDGMAAGLNDIVFKVCLVKLRDNEGNEKQAEDILKFLQHPNSSFSKDNHSRSLCQLLGLSLDNFLSVQVRQRQSNVFELLPALLEKHFMWMWMTNHSDQATEDLAEDVRQRMFPKLKCVVDFARILFVREAGKALSLTELHEFVSIFDKLDKSRKLSRENFESNLFDYFDLLLEAFFVNFHRNSQTKVVVKIMQENEKKWIEQSAVVVQIFEFLSLISGSNSPLNLKLLDLEEKQARYRSLKTQFNDAVSSVGTDDLVFQIFEIRNVRNLELMKSLVKSELFRRVFVRFNPSTGGSRNLFDTEVHQSAGQKRPGALISIQCNYVLDKMLPDACAAYKEFWIAVEEGSLQLEKIKVYISDESKIDLSLEHEILSNLAISSTVVAKLYSVQLHKMWRSRVEVLQFFLTEFFDLNAASTDSPENSNASADDIVSDDENTEKASGFCTEALTNHEDATALIEEFLSLCERTTLLSEYLEVFNDVSGAFGCVDSNVWEVLAIMYESRQETLPFLREQQSSDFQQLLDNTDDTIAQDLSLSVINSLISLQQALRSFLSSGPKVSVKEIEESVLLSLKYFVAADGEVNIQNEVGERQKAAKNLIDRIKECSSHINSIKTLHASMGSRGETSKILATAIVNESDSIRFEITTSVVSCTSKVIKTIGTEYSLPQLRDHRSRIIITLSSHKDRSATEHDDFSALKEFVFLIDFLESTFETAERLLNKGHPFYVNRVLHGILSECESKVEELHQEEASWDSFLNDLRRRYDSANYAFGFNLITLFQVWYLGREEHEITSLLYFMKIDPQSLKTVSFQRFNIEKLCISKLTELFCDMFATLDNLPRIEPRIFSNLCVQKTDMCVRPGELLVCQMTPTEKDVISIFLNVWISSQKEFPWISEVVFCSQDTVSDEIILALYRSSREKMRTTFLVEVQNLRQKVLREVIAELIRQSSQQSLGRVAILCRAPESHSIFTVFRDNVVKAKALTEEKLRLVLKECFSNVFFCTSDRPSVGKSEQIVTASCGKSNTFCRIHISGLAQKQAVMAKIQAAKITKDNCVHLDVGSVQNADLLELILFEAVFCETLSTSNAIVQFRPKTLYLEIANSIDKELEDSFTLLSSLPDAKCEWKHLKNLEVSEEPTSHIQIVCKYLYLLATDTLDFTEVNLTDCVPKQVCLNLLGQFFNHPLEDGKRPSDIMSFLLLESCMKILGEQLKKFTASTYFKVKNLQLVYGAGRTEIRAKMVGLIMQSSLKLTLKSISSIKYQQSESRKNVFDHTIKRFKGLINWEDSSYVLPVFMNQDISTVELIYRRLSDVTPEIHELFSGASSKQLQEFNSISQDELFHKLVKIAAKGQIGYTPSLNKELTENYTLTADNFLKMILITLRVDADVPVIIIGETGCGKTSLIRYLAAVQECQLEVMNFHAGVSESDIIGRISKTAELAKSQLKVFFESPERSGVVWMFLDEVNTCEHLGMLKEIICHRRFLDKELPCNLRFIAACNPYVLRPKRNSSTQAGLEIKELRDDKMMNLVYRVYPLPETMVELVWDFGRLTDSDEQAYISRMVALSIPQKMLRKEITECLSTVQKFIRKLEDSDYATSLRDVRRFCEFYGFFMEYFKKKLSLSDPKSTENPSKRAFLFALYICYYVRIAELKHRNDFAKNVCRFFDKADEAIQNDFKTEELELLKRMRVPRKTARNLALRENVFIIFCCIYCQVPVLLVGKPGCSKSLAVNLIRSNLRGKDSEDPLFRQYPSLRFFSYQGSEASTSEGISRIFTKAEASNNTCSAEGSKPVVLIDEIGLAEKSRYNPLKVLHSLLEPESSLDCKSRVSVVGISNWALDPAKMNRAIHISRPDMNDLELCETGKAICSSESGKSDGLIPDEVLNGVAYACHSYFKEQPFEHFHGLRDFYYLLKFICDRKVEGESKLSTIKEGLLRNFNGGKSSLEEVIKHFEVKFPGLKKAEIGTRDSDKSITETLISMNLRDPHARHLMLIYESEGCLDLLCFMLSQSRRMFKVMYGSQYEKDQYSEEFTYRKLNEVMMSMETGMVLILKDFDLIYGSLYDMLNQNYSEYAGKKYCRIAMGVQANQNCVVHKDFRCIVLVSKKEVRRLDPPFLNRFEKQIFEFDDKICSMKLEKARNELSGLMDNLCRVTSDDVVKKFKRTEIFQGYSPDLIASYLIKAGHSDLEGHQAVREVLPLLYRHMFPDAVLRTSFSNLEDTRQFQREYFSSYNRMTNLGSVLSRVAHSENLVNKVFIYTKFSLYLDICKPLPGLEESFSVKEIRLMDFSREIDLLDCIVPFFKERASNGILLIRIKPSIDERYILHVRCLIDGLCQRYSEEISVRKSVVLIIHRQNEDLDVQNHSWNWSPLMDWDVFFVESLNPESGVNLNDLVSSDCLSPIYENSELMERLHKSVITSALAEAIRSPELMNQAIHFFGRHAVLEEQIRGFIVTEILAKSSKNLQPFTSDHWLVKLALETTQLANFSSFSSFVVHGLTVSYKENLIKILKVMGDFCIFTDNSDSSQTIIKALPAILGYVLQKASSDRFSRVRGLRNLAYPFSTFLFGITYDTFCRHVDDRNTFVTEIETLLRQFLDESELTSSDSRLGSDFWRLITTAFCGRDRHESLRIVLQKQIDQSSQLMEAVFGVLSYFRKSEKDLVDLLNVHHHLHSFADRAADEVVKESFVDGVEFSVTLNNLLSLLLPTEDNLRNLNICEFNEWRRVTGSFLGMLRARSEGLDCVAELEGMLKFCDFFTDHDADVEMSVVFSKLKDRGLLTSPDVSVQLLQWRALASSLSNDNEYGDRLISAEISFYHSVLSGAKLNENLLEEVVKKIFDGILPVGFIAILWNKLRSESKDLVPFFGELMESCKSLEKRCSIYSIIATFLSCEDSIDIESLMETLENIRSLLNKSLAIGLSEMVDVSDILAYFDASVKTSTVSHNDLLCFGEHRDDMLAKVNKLIQTNVVHPLWLSFLRFLRRRYSLAEIETFLKFDRVTSVVSSLFREDFLKLGRGSDFIAAYSLRYPFAVCQDPAVFKQALFAYQQAMIIKDFNEFGKLKQQLKSLVGDDAAFRSFQSDCISAYVEMVVLRKSISNFKVQEKQVTREVLSLADIVPASTCSSAIIRLICGEKESIFNCFNLTAQCNIEGVCLATLYYAGLFVCLSTDLQAGGLLQTLSNIQISDGREISKIVFSRRKDSQQIAIQVRVCSCYNVTICSENVDDPNASYPCQFCHSDWTQDLSSKMVEFSEEFLTEAVPLVSEFICVLMKAVLIDIKRLNSTTAAHYDLKIDEKFRVLQCTLHLSCEETTWLLHSILENKDELFFCKQQSDSSDPYENLAFFVGKHVLKSMQSIREFKRRRLSERGVVENFALACLVDNVDLSDDQLPNELVPSNRTKEDVKAIATNPLFFPKRLVSFSDACMLFDCHLAEGERHSMMHLILRFSDKLVRMQHASKLVLWHQMVLRKSENSLTQEELEAMRIDDFLRRFRGSDILDSASVAWRALRPTGVSGADNPFDRTRSLLNSLLTERAEVTKALRESVAGVNEFLEHVAVLCIEEKRLPELLFDDNSCVLPLCDVVSRPDSVPSCSMEELDELVRVLASCPGGGDPSVHWELLEATLAKRLLAGKGFGCVEPWEGRLTGATERDLGTLVSVFKQMCQCERLSEAELAAFQRRQKEDSTRAARISSLCRTLLGFCHRLGVPDGGCTVADFLRQHAGSLAGGAALAEAEAEGAGGLALSKVPALLEASEQEQFSVVCTDLQRRFGGHEETAERLTNSVPEGDKPTLLAMLKSACVRLLMADSAQCGLTMADLLGDASLLPVGASPIRVRSDPVLDKPAVELLFPLTHCLYKSEQNKTKGQRKFQKLMNRL